MRLLHSPVRVFVVAAVLAGTPYAVQAESLIGHWAFEEGSGNVALDASGNGLNGIIVNATYTAGKRGSYALDFNGSNTYVQVGNNAKLVPATLAISLWFKARGSQVPTADILDKGHGSGSNPYYAGYVLQWSEASPSQLDAVYGNGSNCTLMRCG